MSSEVDAYEKLGAFYLGRPWDPESGETAEAPLLCDSKDLVTHAVCAGRTSTWRRSSTASRSRRSSASG